MEKNKIAVVYGQDMRDMVQQLMEYADIASQLHDGMKIGIKPNLVVAKRPDSGATTNPARLKREKMLSRYFCEMPCRWAMSRSGTNEPSAGSFAARSAMTRSA